MDTSRSPFTHHRKPAWLSDVLVTAVAIAMSIGTTVAHTERGHASARAIAFIVIGGVCLLARRRWPIAILITSLVCMSLSIHFTDGRNGAAILCMFALYTVATLRPRGVIKISCGTVIAAYIASNALAPGFSWNKDAIGPIASFIAAIAFGEAVASRRAYFAAMEERARRAEETREEEARRRVAEERLHIARELHDVIAHHITVISAHAGSASQLLHTDIEGADVALRHVRQASRSVLEELSGMLHLLRHGDDSDRTAPAPTLNAIPQLIETFAAAGLQITAQIDDPPFALSPTSELVAYRITQEALTNARKHGDGHAVLEIRQDRDAFHIHVSNRPGIAAVNTSGGFGISGMHERASAVRGTVEAALKDDGKFHVHAELPRELEKTDDHSRRSC